MRALTAAPIVANSTCGEGIAELPPSAGALPVHTLALGVCATDREIVSGVHGGVPPAGKRQEIGHGSFGGVTQVGGVGAPGRAFSIGLGSVNRPLVLDNERIFASATANAVAAPQQASKGRLGRLIMRRVPAERWTQALAPEPDDDKVVADFS